MAKTAAKESPKSIEGKKKLATTQNALAVLRSLNGKTYAQMTKTEQEALVTALGQLLGVMDGDGKVRV